MDKTKLKIIYGAIAVVIVVAGYFTIKWLKESNTNNVSNENIEDYTPQAEISEEQARQTIVTLYFPNKESDVLMPEARLVDVKEIMNTPYDKLVSLLMEGPKNEKMYSIIDKNAKLLKTYLDKDCVVLDFSKDFLNYDTEKENAKSNLINSIVNTLTELNEVNSVKFLIDGVENEQFNENYVRILK